MLLRAECEHTFRKRYEYSVATCSKCGVIDRGDGTKDLNARTREALNEAEKKHGPFGCGPGLVSVIEGHGGLAFFAVLDKKGKWLAATVGGACYYPLRDLKNSGLGTKTHYILDWPFGGGHAKDEGWLEDAWKTVGGADGWASKWFTWMANQSPWSYIFMTKDWLTAWEKGVVYRTDAPAEQVMNAMCGIRYIGENPAVPKFWVATMPHTDNPMLALLAAHNGYEADGEAVSREFASNHSMWYQPYFNPKKQIARLLEGNLYVDPQEKTPNLKDRWAWYECVSVFGPDYARGYGGTPATKLKLPEAGTKLVKDLFGGVYQEGSGKTVAAWMSEFEKEVRKWQKSASPGS